ncbi:MAG: molybdenum cofactor biosynthesis protein MoaE [Chloroflexota bacterium]
MIEVAEAPISPQRVIDKAKSDSSGCVVTYIGLIRNYSEGKPVSSVEYQDSTGSAADTLREIAGEARRRWQLENVAISHRIGKLGVGEVNLVVAVASAHRDEGFAACRYVIDQFKRRLPTQKTETYQDGSVLVEKAGQKE